MTEQTVQEIAGLYLAAGSQAYFGENVTQLDHALQSAHCALLAHADAELVCAAFLHDIGHLLGGDQHSSIGVIDHDRIAIDWLRARGFSERLVSLAGGHVTAKRYLVTTNPAYFDRLSEASKQTLALQGGKLNHAELRNFEQSPYFEDTLRLRSWDEMAKDPDAIVPGLENYIGLLRALPEHPPA